MTEIEIGTTNQPFKVFGKEYLSVEELLNDYFYFEYSDTYYFRAPVEYTLIFLSRTFSGMTLRKLAFSLLSAETVSEMLWEQGKYSKKLDVLCPFIYLNRSRGWGDEKMVLHINKQQQTFLYRKLPKIKRFYLSVRNFIVQILKDADKIELKKGSPFYIFGKKYNESILTDKKSVETIKLPKGEILCKEGIYILFLWERYPCFDSYDYISENRYYNIFFFCSSLKRAKNIYEYLVSNSIGVTDAKNRYNHLRPFVYVDDGEETFSVYPSWTDVFKNRRLCRRRTGK
jgi:hypothetical protein